MLQYSYDLVETFTPNLLLCSLICFIQLLSRWMAIDIQRGDLFLTLWSNLNEADKKVTDYIKKKEEDIQRG